MVLLSVLSGASASFVCTADRDKIMERGTHYTLQIKGGIGMKLKFIGADHEVTGSCHYLEACGKHILLRYGTGRKCI